jgi:hypothetical protein
VSDDTLVHGVGGEEIVVLDYVWANGEVALVRKGVASTAMMEWFCAVGVLDWAFGIWEYLKKRNG